MRIFLSVFGNRVKADQFGNFLAGFTGYNAGNNSWLGTDFGNSGVRSGGVYYDFKDNFRSGIVKLFGDNNLSLKERVVFGAIDFIKFDWDKDSLKDIYLGRAAAKFKILNGDSKFFKCLCK